MWRLPCMDYSPLYRASVDEVIYRIKEAIQKERNDAVYFQKLSQMATSQDEKKIIDSVAEEEKKHVETLRKLHMEMTGEDFMPISESVDVPGNYSEAIKKALKSEAEDAGKYNEIFEKYLIQNTN